MPAPAVKIWPSCAATPQGRPARAARPPAPLWCTLVIVPLLAAVSAAPGQTSAPSAPSDRPASSALTAVPLYAAGPPEQTQKRALGVRRHGLSGRYAALGKRLFAKHDYGQSARQLALAYTFEPQPELLLETARACRKAELDYEALALFERLQKDPPQALYREEIEDEVKALHAKWEDADFAIASTLRQHLELAKRSFQDGQFAVAAQESAMAYLMRPLPRLLFNIAQAYRRAAQPDEAYLLYVLYLEEDPQSLLKKETLGYVNELRAVVFHPPLHKRAWFWGVMGTLAAGVVAATGAILITQPWVPRVSFD